MSEVLSKTAHIGQAIVQLECRRITIDGAVGGRVGTADIHEGEESDSCRAELERAAQTLADAPAGE